MVLHLGFEKPQELYSSNHDRLTASQLNTEGSGSATVLPLGGPCNQGVQLATCMHAKHITVAEAVRPLEGCTFNWGGTGPPGPSFSDASASERQWYC
jgi:hypothetical protein